MCRVYDECAVCCHCPHFLVVPFSNPPLSTNQGTPEGVEDSGTLTRIAAFPIGIDPERFQEAVQSEAVQARIAQLRRDYGSRKVGCWVVGLVSYWDGVVLTMS